MERAVSLTIKPAITALRLTKKVAHNPNLHDLAKNSPL